MDACLPECVMKKKKIAGIVMAALISGVLAGCTGSPHAEEPRQSPAVKTDSSGEVSSPGGDSVSKANPKTNDAEGSSVSGEGGTKPASIIPLSKGVADLGSDYQNHDDGTFDFYAGSADSLYVTAETKGLVELRTAMNEENIRRRDEAVQMVRESYDGSGTGCRVESQAVPIRSDTNVVSYVRRICTYGENQDEIRDCRCEGVNFDPDTGGILSLRDFVKDTEGFSKLAEAMQSGIDLTVPDSYSLVCGHSGLYVYSAAAGDDAADPLLVPFAGNETVFTDRALNMPESWAEETVQKKDGVFECAVPAKSGASKCQIRPVTDEYGSIKWLQCVKDGGAAKILDGIEDQCYYPVGMKTYVIHRTGLGNRIYLYLPGDGGCSVLAVYDPENDMALCGTMDGVDTEYYMPDDSLSVRAVGDGDANIYDIGVSPAELSILTDPDSFRLYSTVALIGTAGASRHYRVGASGLPEPLDRYYTYNFWMMEMFLEGGSRLDLNGTVVERTSSGDGGEPLQSGEELKDTGVRAVIRAGEPVTALYTDGSSFVVFRNEQGTLIKVPADNSSWPVYLDGKETENVFPNAVFAG